jgi:hypothetical protein
MRRRLFILGLLIFFVVIGSFAFKGYGSGALKNPKLDTSSSPGIHTGNQKKTTTSSHQSDVASLPPNKSAALTAAVNATSRITDSLIQPPSYVRQIVRELVVPGKRLALQRALIATGPSIWNKGMNYPTAYDAQQLSGYSVWTLKYRIASFDGRRASIWLYLLNSFVAQNTTGTKKVHEKSLSIRVVNMRRVGAKWYYVSASFPPANGMPTPKKNLTYKQTNQQYQPFLGGFDSYEGVQAG